jgi:predicted acylesterase/phospholipase RssA
VRIGIVASIGGLKPIALVGLLQAMLDKGLYQSIVGFSGSSGGSIWCALAAKGFFPSELKEMALSITSPDVYEDWEYRKLITAIIYSVLHKKLFPGFTGLIEGDKIRNWMYDKIGHVTFEDLPIPCYITALDINEARGCLFGPGMTEVPVEVAKAVRASTAIPFGFCHETIKISKNGPDIGFWDGGVVSCLPLAPMHDFIKPDVIIALDAVGASNPQGRPWISINDLSIMDLLETMVQALVDQANSLAMRVASDIPIKVMPVTLGASMSNPGGTIGPAIDQSYKDAMVFLQKEFGV